MIFDLIPFVLIPHLFSFSRKSMKELPYFFTGSFMKTIGFLSFWNSLSFYFKKPGISGCLISNFQNTRTRGYLTKSNTCMGMYSNSRYVCVTTPYVLLLYSLTRLTLEGNLATSSLPCYKIIHQPNCNNLGKNRKNITSVFFCWQNFSFLNKKFGKKWIFFFWSSVNSTNFSNFWGKDCQTL